MFLLTVLTVCTLECTTYNLKSQPNLKMHTKINNWQSQMFWIHYLQHDITPADVSHEISQRTQKLAVWGPQYGFVGKMLCLSR